MARKGRKARIAQEKRQRRNRIAAGVALLALGAVVILLVLARPGPAPELTAEGEPVLGSGDAPVTVYYFADFQCPHCREFELGGNMEQLREEYVDPGRVRLAFKDFPVLGDDSWRAARASQFVWDTAPSAYWEWHRGLFQAQGQEAGWASEDFLVEYSERYPEVDASALRDALRGDAYRSEVETDYETGIAHGVRGTPAVIVGGEVVNPLDYAALSAAIDEALAEREG